MDGRYQRGYIADCLGWHLSAEQRKSEINCTRCSNSNSNIDNRMVLDISMKRLPYIMCIMLNRECFIINETLNYTTDMFDAIFKLRAVVYGDGNHFVARFISNDGQIWYHDGMTTGSNCVLEVQLKQIPDKDWFTTASNNYSCREAVLAVYTRE
jgi:hypothetical protein